MDSLDFRKALRQSAWPLTFPGHWLGYRFSQVGTVRQNLCSLNPNSGELLLRYGIESSDIELALSFSEKMWSLREPLEGRLRALSSFKDKLISWREDLVFALRVEAGKTRSEADFEFDAAEQILDRLLEGTHPFFEALAGKPFLLDKKTIQANLIPSKITVAFLPFASPLTSLALYLGSSVLLGSPLICCPSSHATLVGSCLAFMLAELEGSGLHVCVLFGDFSRFKKILVDARVQTILYTGSRDHCEMIKQESKPFLGRRLVLQSGGKNSLILGNDFDLKEALRLTVKGAFDSAGQLCSSTSRVILPSQRMAEFKEALREVLENLRIGRTDQNGDKEVDMGPLYSSKAVERFLRYETMASRLLGEPVLRGSALNREKGYFVTPSVHHLSIEQNQSIYESHVLFSPSLSLYSYKDIDEALFIANATDSPYICSWLGDEDLFGEKSSVLTAPNLCYGRATSELDPFTTVSASFGGGHQRYVGIEIASALSYPQIIHPKSC